MPVPNPISWFRFCGENVGRSFVVCSHDPIFRTDKESFFNLAPKQSHAKYVGAFHLSGRVSDEIKHVLFPFVFFFKIRDLCVEGHYQCVHTIRFSEPTKIGSVKMDRVNGP